MRRDTAEFIAAFAIGSVLGAGAALLLAPDGNGRARTVRRLAERRRLLREGAARVREGLDRGADVAGAATGEAASLAGSVARAVGEELRRVLRTGDG